MRDHHQRSLVLQEKVFQPVDGVEVQRVGRLVEQQRSRLSEQRLGEQHADLVSAGDFAHDLVVVLLEDAEAIEQRGGLRLGGVAVLFRDHAFQLAEPRAVFVGKIRLGEQAILFLHRLPEDGIAHQHGVDDAFFLERVLVLLED